MSFGHQDKKQNLFQISDNKIHDTPSLNLLNHMDNIKISNQFELISLNEDSDDEIDIDNYMDNFRLKME